MVVVGAAALIVVVVATRAGVGMSTDSVTYVAEARALREGSGLGVPAGIYAIYDDAVRDTETVTGPHFPPLFPAVLAAVDPTHEPGANGRLVDEICFVITMLTLAVMVHAYTRSRLFARAAAGVAALSGPVLLVHGMVWSEPLFIALGLLGLLAISAYLERGETSTLVGAALAMGLAWLTRYAGIAFVVTGVVVLARGGASTRRKIVTFLAFSCLPMLAYLVAMRVAGATAGGFTLALHRPAESALRQGGDSLRAWIVPTSVPTARLLLFLVGAVSVSVWSTRSRREVSGHDLPRLPLVLAVFLVAYAAVLVVSETVFADAVPLDGRMLAPAYVVAVALVACGLSHVLAQRLLVKAPVLGLVATIGAATVAGGWPQVHRGAPDYPSFTVPAWTSSALLRDVSTLGPNVRIYSNFPEVVYLATGRVARLLPKYVLADGKPNLEYAAQLARVVDRVRAGDAVAVVFDTTGRGQVTDGPVLAAHLGEPTASDRLVWRWEGGRPRAAASSGPSPPPGSR